MNLIRIRLSAFVCFHANSWKYRCSQSPVVNSASRAHKRQMIRSRTCGEQRWVYNLSTCAWLSTLAMKRRFHGRRLVSGRKIKSITAWLPQTERRLAEFQKFIEFEFRVEFRVTRKCNWWNTVRNNFAPYLHIICMLLCIIQLDKFQQSSTATRCIECRYPTFSSNSKLDSKLELDEFLKLG